MDLQSGLLSSVTFISAVLSVKVFADALWSYRWLTAATPCMFVGVLSAAALAMQLSCPALCSKLAHRGSRPELQRAMRSYACAAVTTGFLDAITALLALTSLASVPAHLALVALAAPDSARALGSLLSARVSASREGRTIPSTLIAAHVIVPVSVLISLAVLVGAACSVANLHSLSSWGGKLLRLPDGNPALASGCHTLLVVEEASVGGGASLAYATAPCTEAQTEALAAAVLMLTGSVLFRATAQVRVRMGARACASSCDLAPSLSHFCHL